MIRLIALMIIMYITCASSLHSEHLPEQTFTHFNSSETHAAFCYHTYFMAHYYHRTGSMKQSLAYYHRLLNKAAPIEMYDGYLTLLFDLGQFDTFIKTVTNKEAELKPLFEKNLHLQLLVAQAYLHTNHDEKACTYFTQLSKEFPHNEQVAYYSVISLLKKNELAKALTLINQHINNNQLRARHFLFHFLASKIYLQQNKSNQALIEIEKSVTLFPRFDRGWLLRAMLMEQQKKFSEAINSYQKFLALVGRDQQSEKQLVHLLFQEKRYKEAAEYLERINNHSAEFYFDLALIYSKALNYKKAWNTLDKALKKDPKLVRARFLKLELLAQKNNRAELINYLAAWLSEEPAESPTSVQVLMLLKEHIINQELLTQALESVVQEKKAGLHHLLALAELYGNQKQSLRAIDLYEKILAATDNHELRSHLFFNLAQLYTDLGDKDSAERTLAQAASLPYDNPLVHNALAYHYAQHKKNLQQAHELIDKALAHNPASGNFLDTKGYIFLQEGNKEEARTFFKKALALNPDNCIIQEHMKLAE